jgi:hypothetical protein
VQVRTRRAPVPACQRVRPHLRDERAIADWLARLAKDQWGQELCDDIAEDTRNPKQSDGTNVAHSDARNRVRKLCSNCTLTIP